MPEELGGDCATTAAISTRSGVPRMRPPVESVSNSAIAGMPHASSSRSPNSASVGFSISENTGSISSPKPIATINGPV